MSPDTQTFEIPRPLKMEHEELHTQLARATKEVGEVGTAAREVARILHPHFVAKRRSRCRRLDCCGRWRPERLTRT